VSDGRERANFRLADLVRAHQVIIDQTLARALPVAHAQTPIPCQRGCAHCCSLIVIVDEAEAELIVDTHEGLAKRAASVMRRQLERLAATAGPAPRAGMVDRDWERHLGDVWRDLDQPCAFLDPETKDCRIYDVRPVACRTFFITGPDASGCERTRGTSQIVDVAGTRSKAYHALLEPLWKLRGEAIVSLLPDLVLRVLKKRGKNV
jgi:Fe-S-cluster containining protein